MIHSTIIFVFVIFVLRNLFVLFCFCSLSVLIFIFVLVFVFVVVVFCFSFSFCCSFCSLLFKFLFLFLFLLFFFFSFFFLFLFLFFFFCFYSFFHFCFYFCSYFCFIFSSLLVYNFSSPLFFFFHSLLLFSSRLKTFSPSCYLTRPSPLPSPWNHIPSSEDILYLGVPISLEGEIGDFWRRPMAKARAVAHCINNKHLKISTQMYLINTHIISLFQYLMCFVLFPPCFFTELMIFVQLKCCPPFLLLPPFNCPWNPQPVFC